VREQETELEIVFLTSAKRGESTALVPAG